MVRFKQNKKLTFTILAIMSLLNSFSFSALANHGNDEGVEIQMEFYKEPGAPDLTAKVEPVCGYLPDVMEYLSTNISTPPKYQPSFPAELGADEKKVLMFPDGSFVTVLIWKDNYIPIDSLACATVVGGMDLLQAEFQKSPAIGPETQFFNVETIPEKVISEPRKKRTPLEEALVSNVPKIEV